VRLEGWLFTRFFLRDQRLPAPGTALRPNKKPSTPYGRFLVAIADRDAAVRAIQEWFPNTKVVVNSEASPETLAAWGLKDGTISALTRHSRRQH
jgi:hypothetical protein